MGTRSLTYVYNDNDSKQPFVCMYRQFDGYPSGHGAELADFLYDGKLVNGIPFGSKEKLFNGMGCLAAQMVAHFKDGPGEFYLYPPDLEQDAWQDYEYHLYPNSVKITSAGGGAQFKGTWEEFAEYCESKE